MSPHSPLAADTAWRWGDHCKRQYNKADHLPHLVEAGFTSILQLQVHLQLMVITIDEREHWNAKVQEGVGQVPRG